jgi:phosphoribosyl-ATP pyrophosphohydrolase
MNKHHGREPLPLERVTIERLCGIIAIRASELKTGSIRVEDSYTAKLLRQGVEQCAKKVGEEAAEVVIEAAKRDKQKFIAEMAQLIYHELVLMQAMGVSMRDVEDELSLVHAQMTGNPKADKRGT